MSFDCTPPNMDDYAMSDFDVEDAVPCAVCGSVDVTDDWTFHWRTPFSSEMVVETCSPACTAVVAATRLPNGYLPDFKKAS